MNAVIRFAIIAAIVTGIGVAVNQVVQATFGSQINGAIIYWLVAMAPMNFVVPIAAVYNAIQILGNFLYGVLLFILIKWLAQFYTR